MFYVGQKVVCVNGTTQPGCIWLGAEVPRSGRVYTVDALVTNRSGTPALVLVELPRDPVSVACGAIGYHAYRFRPVVERKTDISALKALLNTAPEKVLA